MELSEELKNGIYSKIHAALIKYIVIKNKNSFMLKVRKAFIKCAKLKCLI